MAVTVIILIALTFNLAFLHGQSAVGTIHSPSKMLSNVETRRLHHVQREFMVQTLMFFFFIGIAALIFSKVESYTFVTGIYFMIVTTLTIGFGDITPHTTAMKVLVFPFAVLGLSLLAVIVTSIVRLLSDRARRRKLQLAKRLKEQQTEKKRLFGALPKLSRLSSKSVSISVDDNANPLNTNALNPTLSMKTNLSLQDELYQLREEDWRRERRANIQAMAIGMAIFFVFWFIGALIFHFVEVHSPRFLSEFEKVLIAGLGLWKLSLLLLCVRFILFAKADNRFFLTIGYGDFFPATEAGRPIFIVYALLAVPTMTIVGTSLFPVLI